MNGISSYDSKWLGALHEGKYIRCVMLDFRKVFDIINIPILCKILNLYKCHTSALKWSESYLTNKKQIIAVNGENSRNLNTICGIPQGYIRGPLFFLIFIDDLPQNTVTNTDTYVCR